MVMIPSDVEQALPRYRESYFAREKMPFNHFFCPILLKDESTKLCMGHVVPEAFSNCCRSRVIQRADVDNWYGSRFEADFGALLEVRGAGLDATLKSNLRKRIRPQIKINGETIPSYFYKEGNKPPATQSRILLENETTGTIHYIVLRKEPEEILAAQGGKWNLTIELDSRTSALVTLIKSAYLTLFYAHGYRWALSAAGLSIGRSVLGRFYEENRVRTADEVMDEADKFFYPYRHMVRPIRDKSCVVDLLGTVEDNRTLICFCSSGRPFALIVWVRIGGDLHAVLMPAWNNPESAYVYDDFLNGDKETLLVNDARFDADEKQWIVNPDAIELYWPKNHESYDISKVKEDVFSR